MFRQLCPSLSLSPFPISLFLCLISKLSFPLFNSLPFFLLPFPSVSSSSISYISILISFIAHHCAPVFFSLPHSLYIPLALRICFPLKKRPFHFHSQYLDTIITFLVAGKEHTLNDNTKRMGTFGGEKSNILLILRPQNQSISFLDSFFISKFCSSL